MSCELGMLTGWVNYISNLLNWISYANFNTKTAGSVEIRNVANS